MRYSRIIAASSILCLLALGRALPGLGLSQDPTVEVRLAARSPWTVRASRPWTLNGRLLPAGCYELVATAGSVSVRRPGTASFAMAGPCLRAASDGGRLRVNGRSYRGSLVFRPGAVINEVTLRQYLYGVVAHEMGGGADLEALKAQAVVARTYALAHMWGGAFTDGTAFQVYAGADGETAAARRAVDETRGEVLTWKGRLARFVCYHSTCGGHTESNENVFMTPPVPYLRGVVEAAAEAADDDDDDAAAPAAADRIASGPPPSNPDNGAHPAVTPSPADCADAAPTPAAFPPPGAASACSHSPYYRWTVTWPPGVHVDARILERSPNGRVVRLQVDGREYVGDEIRRALRFRTAAGREMNLYSTFFDLCVENGCLVAHGAGWGHGVGLCQWGARGMARAGRTYAEILAHYFPGTTLSGMR